MFLFIQVSEHVIDYTRCLKDNSPEVNLTCADELSKAIENNISLPECKCTIPFTLEEDFKGKVYMYYGLTNYYQNHRRYVKSRDDDQLLGKLSFTPSSDCKPFAYVMENDVETAKVIAPCGAIANSLFSDSFSLTWYNQNEKNNQSVPLLRTDISWPSDRKYKFNNPDNLRTALQNFSKPRAWTKNLWELDLEDENNNGFMVNYKFMNI